MYIYIEALTKKCIVIHFIITVQCDKYIYRFIEVLSETQNLNIFPQKHNGSLNLISPVWILYFLLYLGLCYFNLFLNMSLQINPN